VQPGGAGVHRQGVLWTPYIYIDLIAYICIDLYEPGGAGVHR
jgi:hypothetical protein